jgi:autotransporter-associated beta strand protein
VNITGALNAGNNTLTNSSTNVRIDNGSVTVGGTTSINNNNNSRWSVFQVNGGTFTSNDSTGAGVLVGGFNAATDDEFLVSGGTSTVQQITLGNAPQATGTNVLSLTGGALYIGAGGIVSGVATPTYTNLITLGNGTIGAAADWSSTLPMTLTGSTGTTFLTSNLAGTGHNITLKGVVSGTGKLIVSGTGSLTLTAANTYTGPTTVNSGTLNLNNPQAIVATGTLNVGGTGTVVLSETQGTTNLAALNVTGNGTFDVTNNAVFINYSAAGQTSPDAAIRSALISGSGTNGVTYNGVGIISSTAARLNAALVANNGTPAYGVGYADGSDPYLNNEGPAAGVEEVKLTLLGDLNLDGFVNSADFILFANSFGKTGGTAAAWDHGDLNYDGSVNSADFILFADEFGKGLGTVSSTDGGLTLAQGGLDAAQVQQFNQIGTDLGISSTELAQLDLKVAAVPEPASLGLLVIGGLGLMGRRRRRNA